MYKCVSQLLSSCLGPFIKMEAPTAGGRELAPLTDPFPTSRTKISALTDAGIFLLRRAFQAFKRNDSLAHPLTSSPLRTSQMWKNTWSGTKAVPAAEGALLLAPRLYLLIGASARLFFCISRTFQTLSQDVCLLSPPSSPPPPPPPPLPCFIYSLFEKPNFCNSKPKQPRR